MKAFLIISIFLLIFVSSANSYPQSEIETCVSSALSNPATKSIPEESIANYCDCALKAIIDENKNIRDSGYKCAQKYFN